MRDVDEAPLTLLLASSVHDIKNSLGLLMETLAVTVAESDPNDRHQRQHFATMQGHAARINNDLMSLLGIYRLQEQRLPVRIDEVYVREFLDDQLAQQQLLLETRGIHYQLSCDATLVGYFDPSLISGILNDVLINALRYSRQEILIHAEACKGGGVEITVTDDGAGFPEEMLAEDTSASRPIDFASGSTHLGLYFARAVAALHRRGELHGGVRLSNRREGGAEFRLFLP